MDEKPLAPLDEISVSAKIEEAGITAAAKSRAVTAIDRLLGAAVDWVGIGIEASSEARRSKAKNDREIIEARGAAALELIQDDPELRARLGQRVLQDALRKQKNLDAIVAGASQELLLLSAPASTGPGAEDNSAAIDDDWINLFSRYAENASSQRLQEVWGKVLAGEIVRPGSFSLSTLRFVAELDAEVAHAFEQEAPLILNGSIVVLEGGVSGERFQRLKLLEECGLLFGVSGMVTQEVKLTSKFTFQEIAGDEGIVLAGEPGIEIKYHAAFLTRIGREVWALTSPEQDVAKLCDFLVPLFKKDGVSKIERVAVKRLGEGRVDIVERSTLWSRD